MMKVGFDVIFDEKKGKERKVTYSDVHYDADKWVDATKFLPADFDLVYMKSPNHAKTVSGWSTGRNWDGLNLKPGIKVQYWKRHE